MAKEKAVAKKAAENKAAAKAVIGPFEGSTTHFNPKTGAGVTLPGGCTLEWVEEVVTKAKINKV